MSETITLHALDLSGETTLKLFLRKDDGTLLNTGGDDLAEIGSSGVFTAILAESRTGLGDLSYRVCLATETADNLLIDGFLPEAETTIGASSTAVLDSASVSAIRDGIPKVGETHRYTQVDSGATTTDVSIGEAT